MDVNRPIYLVLIAGVIISSVLLGAAFVLNLIAPSRSEVVYVMELAGVCVLIATPYARILVSAVAFSANREGKYVALSIIVLSIMLLSLILGILFHISPGT